MKKRTFVICVLFLVLFPLITLAEGELRSYNKKEGYVYVTLGRYYQSVDSGNAKVDGGQPEKKTRSWFNHPIKKDATYTTSLEPLLWRVLTVDDEKAYLASEYVLFAHPMHVDYDEYAKIGSDFGATELCYYLNHDFADVAFSTAEMDMLLPKLTYGKVFLLEANDLKNEEIGMGLGKGLKCWATEYAVRVTGQYVFDQKYGAHSAYWVLNQSTTDPHHARCTKDGGQLGHIVSSRENEGVRPAVYLKLDSLSINGGSGTKDDPYRLDIPEALTDTPMDETVPVEEMALLKETEETPAKASEESFLEAPSDDKPEEDGSHEEPAEEASNNGLDYADESVGFTAAADRSKINALFPTLTAQGFLPEGEEEFVYIDEDAGLWLYASQTLRIEINRRTEINSKKQTLHWYEAQIFTRDSDELFGLYPYDEARYTNPYALGLANEIALKHHLVFGINSDYFIYRVGRDKEESYNYPIGIIIRDGKVMYTQSKSSASEAYPPLDLMAFYGDGQVKVFQNELPKDSKQRAAAEKQLAQDLIDSGVTNTLAFGPILVENGQVSPRASAFGVYSNPRTSFGYVEPGHYICVVIQGRVKGEAQGESCVWLAEKMAELGCDCAINLDGGATSTMLFMGQQISKSGNYGDITNRKQNELLGIGISPNVK